MTNILEERKNKLMKLMRDKGIKAVILSPSANMYYMTGFSTFPGERFLTSIIVDSGEIVFVVPKLYEQEVKEKAYYSRILAWDDSQNPIDLLEGIVAQYGLESCGIAIEDTMWFNSFEKIMKTFINANYKPASEFVGQLRMCKLHDELIKLRKASELADTALNNTVGRIKPGMTELEVKDLLEQEMKSLGITSPSFETIIGSGTNSALPHYTAGNKVIEVGNAVVVDFGGIYEGYCSDMTRTFVLGKPSEEFIEVYNVVKEAQQKAVESVRPGIKACEIDKAARSYIVDKGYGEYFIHRTGHGAGIEVHEAPYITDKSEVILRPGMVFSIEPGIYLPGKFGVRIEDLVVVKEDGVEVLNKYDKTLKIL